MASCLLMLTGVVLGWQALRPLVPLPSCEPAGRAVAAGGGVDVVATGQAGG